MRAARCNFGVKTTLVTNSAIGRQLETVLEGFSVVYQAKIRFRWLPSWQWLGKTHGRASPSILRRCSALLIPKFKAPVSHSPQDMTEIRVSKLSNFPKTFTPPRSSGKFFGSAPHKNFPANLTNKTLRKVWGVFKSI